MTTPAPDPTKAALDHVDREIKHVKEIIALERQHAKEIRRAEKGRLDAIREVDMKAVQVLATNVENTRVTLASQNKEDYEKLSGRITFLEGNQAQNTGKSSIWSNPIVVAILAVIFGYLVNEFK